jgi:hypothetical protein
MTQLANLFTTVFTTELNDDNDEMHLNPLNRLMSHLFPAKKYQGAPERELPEC